VRLVAWTIGWTLYQWWAVIGWPATVDEAHFALMVACGGSSVGLTVWYGLHRMVNWPAPLR
jgi:DMSO reductase anchor subunit